MRPLTETNICNKFLTLCNENNPYICKAPEIPILNLLHNIENQAAILILIMRSI